MNIKKTIITILSAIVIIMAIVLCKNYLSYKIPNEAMGVRSIVALKEVDTLFIGSSGYRKGIDMEEVVKALPGKSYMLTYNGNEPFNILIELKELLKENVKIGRVIIDYNPSMMDRGADLSDKRLLWDISMDGKKELWSKIKEEDSTTLFTFYDYWILSNNDYMFTYPISYPLIAARYNYGGSTVADETSGKNKEELEELAVVEKPGINPLEGQSIVDIISLCKGNDIEVIFLESPRYITMESDINYQGKSEELHSIIEEAGGKAILRSDLNFDNSHADYYTDLTHMSGSGKKAFTKEIISILK